MPAPLPKTLRLRRRADFRRAYDDGRRYRASGLALFVFARHDSAPPRLGVTVTRAAGGAVRRNRMRRLVREAYRRLAPTLSPGFDLVVNLYPRTPPWDLTQVSRALATALLRADILPAQPA